MTGKNNSAQGASKKGKAVLHANHSRTFKKLSSYAGVENNTQLSKRDLENAAAVGSLNKSAGSAKRLHHFAPSAAKVDEEVNNNNNNNNNTAEQAAVTDIAVFQVMQASRLCENTVNRDMRRVVTTVANTPIQTPTTKNSSQRVVRRIVCKGKRDRMNGIIVGTCELAAKGIDSAILVVEPTDDDAKRLCELYKTLGVPAALIVDAQDSDDKSVAKKKSNQNPALTSLAAPIVVDPKVLKNNKFLQLAAANRQPQSVDTTDNSNNDNITFALKKAPKVGVTSLSSIFTSVNDTHVRQYNIIIVDEPQPRDEELYATLAMMLTKVRNVHIVASTPELALNSCVAPLCGTTTKDEEESVGASSSAFTNKDLPVSFVTTEGLPRLQTLLALLQNSGQNNKIVVQCATQDCAIFLCDLMFALNCPEEGNFKLFCDSENKDDKSQLAVDVATISDRFDRAAGKAVLLTAYGLLPKSGTVLVQYDPIVSVMNFVVKALAPAAANVAAYQTYQTEVAAMAAANNEPTVPVPFQSPAAAEKYCYRHIIIFFYPSEEAGALTLVSDALRRLEGPNDGWELRPEQIKPVSVNTAAATLLTMKSVKELHQKVFAIQNNAYNAYRSLMQVYSRLHPKTVFDVESLNLEAVAAQFGYEELPLLDLRTKNTQFRPKLDTYRMAAIKNKHTLKRIRKDADVAVVGTGPDEAWMADAAPFKPKDQ